MTGGVPAADPEQRVEALFAPAPGKIVIGHEGRIEGAEIRYAVGIASAPTLDRSAQPGRPRGRDGFRQQGTRQAAIVFPRRSMEIARKPTQLTGAQRSDQRKTSSPGQTEITGIPDKQRSVTHRC